MKQNIVKILNFKVSNELPFFLIAGPCSIESKEHAINHAGMIKEICNKLNVNFVYKSSFDKANRSSSKSSRGVGFENGLTILSEVKKNFNLPILTDVHEIHQCKDIEEIVLGSNGILDYINEGTVVIDHSTTSVETADSISNHLLKKNSHYLDAPVSGGEVGAQNGTLSVMIGGDKGVYKEIS